MSIVRYELDKSNSVFMGVCAGFARITSTDPLWWRIGAVIGTFLGFGLLPIIYLLIGWLAQPRAA
jgi:phage shock protein C